MIQMAKITAGNLEFEIEDHGPRDGVPIVLIAGLGTQLISWPDEWIEGFTRKNYRLILLDNRDIGLSQKMSECGIPNITQLRAKEHVTAKDVPYTLDDMARDVLAIMNALEIDQAHIIGKSMGGVITQAIMHLAPKRVLSATLMVTTSGAKTLPPMEPEADALIYAEYDESTDRDALIEATLAADYVWYSPKYPFDPDIRKQQIAEQFDRSYHPAGVARQRAALFEYSGKESRLADCDKPVMIVQGMDDTIFTPAHGQDLAARIKGSQLLEMDGMGHDLEGAAIEIVFDKIAEFIDSNNP